MMPTAALPRHTLGCAISPACPERSIIQYLFVLFEFYVANRSHTWELTWQMRLRLSCNVPNTPGRFSPVGLNEVAISRPHTVLPFPSHGLPISSSFFQQYPILLLLERC